MRFYFPIILGFRMNIWKVVLFIFFLKWCQYLYRRSTCVLLVIPKLDTIFGNLSKLSVSNVNVNIIVPHIKLHQRTLASFYGLFFPPIVKYVCWYYWLVWLQFKFWILIMCHNWSIGPRLKRIVESCGQMCVHSNLIGFVLSTIDYEWSMFVHESGPQLFLVIIDWL